MSVSTKIFESISADNKKKKMLEATSDYSSTVPANVIAKIDEMLGQAYPGARWRIEDVYKDLSIFDWWPEYLSTSHLKKMKTFLTQAISLGFDKYCCFKVGASGCANGMWASDAPTTDGYSPKDCKTLYRSFTPDYTYYSVDLGTGFGEELKTIREVKEYINGENSDIDTMNSVEPDKVPETTETLDKDSIKNSLVGKTVSEACAYLNELTGLKYNTSTLNKRQVKIFTTNDNYLMVTLDRDKITSVGNINIKK